MKHHTPSPNGLSLYGCAARCDHTYSAKPISSSPSSTPFPFPSSLSNFLAHITIFDIDGAASASIDPAAPSSSLPIATAATDAALPPCHLSELFCLVFVICCGGSYWGWNWGAKLKEDAFNRKEIFGVLQSIRWMLQSGINNLLIYLVLLAVVQMGMGWHINCASTS